MPNTSNDDVIIVGSLSDKELRDSIDKLVDYVGDKTTIMAGKFDVAMEKMKSAMKDFAITQKVSVDLMQDAWKQMSASFDAMLKAQQNATSSGNNSGTGGGNSQYADNTVGHLQEIIALEEKRRKEMTLGSDALRDQNKLIEEQKAKLKGETTSDQVKAAQAAKKELQKAFTMPARGLADAEKKLQQLQSLSAKFQGKGILDQTQWNRLNAQIQATREKIDKLRQKKPTSIQDVLGMDESSVDAIAKKMAALKKVTVDPQNTAQVKQLGDEYQRLSKLQTSLLGKNAQVIRSNNYLAQSFGYIRNRLVYALTLGAISNFTKELYQIRGQYELLERSLGVLLDDMGKGSQIFRELNAMSLKSPFTLIDLAGAAKQLTAYNFAADEVVDTTRRLADISAALGVPMERLVYNLGQIRAQNVLNARDARDFANDGLPIVSMLADMYTEQKRFGDEMVTTANVYDMMSKKMVSYADVLQVINKVTDEGGKFFDFQAKQADTLQVQMANLNLAYNNMLNSIGKENQGVLAGGLSIVKDLLLNWRQVYRVLMTLITTYGAYRTAVALVGWEHKRTFGARMLIRIQQWVNGIKNAKTAMQALNATMSSNVLGLFVSALTAAVSYFWLFNNSADEMKEKLKEIQETFTSMRSNATDIFVSGLKSDNVNTQIDKLKELVSFAESELGITIPVNIQDVDAENVAQKLRDAKNYIDEYLDFAQAFSETAAGNKYLNKYFTEFGNTAQSTFTNIYSSVNTVIEGLQKLADEGRASARDLEILEELVTGKKEDESKLEYLQRLVSLYEELGLIGRKVVTPVISYTHSFEDNMEFLEEQQKKTLDRIKVHNRQVFATMLQDVQDFYSNADIAEYQLERTVEELAERIDINSIPEDQRTLKLSAAINEEASKNNWNDFAKQYARQVANTKFGTTIEISDKSKKNTEVELKEWQKKLQSWADANGIVLGITLNFNTNEVDAANEALQNVKKAQELLAVQQRKLKVGTATQADVDAAEKALKNARLVAIQAGADLASLNRKDNRKESSGGSKKDDVLDVLKDEISLVKKLQSEYDKLTKSGVNSADAIVTMQDAYGSTLRLLNKDLQKFGLPRIELSNILGKNPHEILSVFTELRNILKSKGLSNLERMKAVEGVIEELKVSAKTYDMKKVTDGLNSELGKIKDEYELAIELDANPELGGIFADMMGIDEEQLKTLPRTFNQVVAQLQASIDKLFADNNIDGSFDLTQMLDKGDFDKWVEERGNTLDDTFVKALNKIREYANKVRLDETKETTKNWSQLIDKYGQLQYKLVKIAKDATKEMKNIVNKFGNDEQKKLALDLANKISISQDPSEIARLQEQLRQLLNQVTQGNEQAVNINAAVQNQQNQQTSKAYWDDFKNSDYYTMMFEDMSRNSTRAIQLIIDKMNELKDKVKEDPASMKALSKSLQDAQKELESRSSTVTILDALKEMRTAYDEVTTARKNLANADKEVGDAEKALESSKGDADKTAAAVERLRIARERQKQATLDAANAETKYRAASKKLQGGMETLSSELQNVQSIFGAVAKLFAAAGDDETADAINAISEGFSIMTTIIMGVVAAMELLESTEPWLLAVAAALSVIVGLVSWLSGSNDKEITNEVKKSELAVKRLENSYKNLEKAVEEAFGASEIAAKKAEIANKKLQLAELQRQLQLERSRDSKKRDAGKIADLEGQIIDLKNEIKDMKNDVTNSFLGISSVKDAVGSMMDDIVDALRNGEDAMGSFNDSIDDMIANMIKQVFSARILGPMLEKIWDKIDADIQKRGEAYADYYADYQSTLDHIDTTTNNTGSGYYFWKDQSGSLWYSNSWMKWQMALREGAENLTYQQWHDILQGWADWAQEHLEDATTPTMADVRRFGTDLRQVAPELEGYMDELENILREMGLIKDATSEEALSKLQQGIQGVTEDTAGAIEAYMNIVAQRVFEQNLYLQEIRDHLNNFDLDVQLGTLSQMLLQLQQSYQVQQNIESILTGVLNPSGRAIVVELNS
jgi:hypothetical protein